jgi:MGT family glycosyltransferase
MSHYLICSSPIFGHVAPMLLIGRHLVERGHRVRMLTGSRFETVVVEAGMEFLPLSGIADYDDRNGGAIFEGGENLRGIKRLRFDLENNFVGVMPDQYAGLRAALDAGVPDVVVTETAFMGVIPLLTAGPASRPPVLTIGVLPLTVSSRDTAPFGSGLQPSTSTLGRVRNRALNALITKVVFGGAQKMVQTRLREFGMPELPFFFLDCSRLVDRVLQLTCEGFEYPRSDLDVPVEFVGPVRPSAGTGELPSWWTDLDGSKPVVHVTQGTIANTDLGQLIRPTLRALENEDVLVVVATGDEAGAAALAGDAPANARISHFVPYAELMPKVDVMVTNGGYGGVQFALSHGVPLVVAGNTEEKPEIAARVAWSGAGLNLRTGSPSAQAIAKAVRTVLTDGAYRSAAQRLSAQFADTDPLESIEKALEDATRAAR